MCLRLIFVVALCVPVAGQEESRVAEIEKARAEKAKHLEPDKVSEQEAALTYIKDNKVLERIQAGINGFRIRMGGTATSGGYAIGGSPVRRQWMK